MSTMEMRILMRFYEETVHRYYTEEQEDRILRLLCMCEGANSSDMEQIVARLRELNITDPVSAECSLLIFSEDEPIYPGLKAIRRAFHETAPKYRDALQWRQEVMLAKEKDLKTAALIAYAEGQVAEALALWEKELVRGHDLDIMIRCAVAYAESEQWERALYRITYARYWARRALMLRHPPLDSLYEKICRSCVDDSQKICQKAEEDAERCMAAGQTRHIGFV